MPVFGKSLFETVLEGLEQDQSEESEPVHRSPRGLGSGFVTGFSTRDDEDIGTPSSFYEDFGPVAGEVLHSEPVWVARLGPEEIAADLQIAACRTEADLKAKRRAFARLNHPDLVHPDYREIATHRMMVANQLVDAALQRLGRQA